MIYSGKPNNEKHKRGVVIFMGNKARKSLIEWKALSDRNVTAQLHTRHRKVTVIQCYYATELATEDDKDSFDDSFTVTLNNKRYKIIYEVVSNNQHREETMEKHME